MLHSPPPSCIDASLAGCCPSSPAYPRVLPTHPSPKGRVLLRGACAFLPGCRPQRTHLCPGLLAPRLCLWRAETGPCHTADHSVHATWAGWLPLAPCWRHLHLAVGYVGLLPQAVDPMDPEGILLGQALQPGGQGRLQMEEGPREAQDSGRPRH